MVSSDQSLNLWYTKFKPVPPDPIMLTGMEFAADKRVNKVNAGIGMIMDPKTGRPFIYQTVAKVAKQIAFDDVSYLPSIGHSGYLEAHARELVFGPDLWNALDKKKIVWTQTLGGTKAMSLTKQLLNLSLSKSDRQVLIDPGWPNNKKIFADFYITDYQHENPATREYNHQEYITNLKKHPKGGVVILQVAGYNDDGTERNKTQWQEILEIIVNRGQLPILDFAYNGLVLGWNQDNYPVQIFTKSGITTFICVSNSKNVAYNARLGSLYIVNVPNSHAEAVQQNLAHNIIRPDYSNPNALTAQTMSIIWNDKTLLESYKKEIDAVRTNILEKNRATLASVLGPSYSWIIKKRGLFLKLIPEGYSDRQYNFLKDKMGIHGPKSSRLNMGGFNPDKMADIAKIYKKTLELT